MRPMAQCFGWSVYLVAGCLLTAGIPSPACTTAVVSASAASNGRPLLWKNRDAEDLHNQLVYCADGRYAYIGLVNKGDAAGMNIWAGTNSEGFSVMNAASYNLEVDKDTKGEGAFMKLALQSCANVNDFQSLLEKTNAGGRDVSANFGVIDGAGGACYFEAGAHAYKRYNADDPLLNSRGILVRSNYSDSADQEKGTGFLRRDRAASLLESLAKDKTLTAESLLREVSRDQANDKIGSYPLTTPRKKGASSFVYTGDSICRYDTASAVVFEGGGPGESPVRSTAWVILGLPSGGVAVPLWVGAGQVPSDMGPGSDPAPLNALFGEVREQLYPDARGDMKKYLDLDSLSNPKFGVRTALLAQEAANFRRVAAAVAQWRDKAPDSSELSALQTSLAQDTIKAVSAALEVRRRNTPGLQKKTRNPPATPTERVTVSDLGR